MRGTRLAVICASILMLCSCGDIMHNAKTGNIERIQSGLDSGVSINKKDHTGYTPLMWATVEKKYEAMDFLCQKGANVNARSDNGATALILAVYYRDYEAAQLIMKYNPDTSINDQYGNRAVDYAQQYYDPRMHELFKMTGGGLPQAPKKDDVDTKKSGSQSGNFSGRDSISSPH